MATTGVITQVIGSTFDAEFPEDQLPAIYNAIKVDNESRGIKVKLTGEVQQHLGGGRVRAIALGTTDGLITYRLFTTNFGSTVSQVESVSVPLPSALPMSCIILGLIGVVTVVARRPSAN